MQERFAIRYVVDWGDVPRERSYPSLPLAEAFAGLITTDGTTAFPHVAAIVRQTRRHDLDMWQDDENFAPIEVKRGQRSSGPGDQGWRERDAA
jgi:hypothetical protein